MGPSAAQTIHSVTGGKRAVLAARLPVLLVLLAVVFAVLTLIPAYDYHFFVDSARAWRSGTSHLYDPAAFGFFYMPWTLLVTVPLSMLPDVLGRVLLNTASLAGLLWATWSLGTPRRLWTAVLAAVSPFLLTILTYGQWDAITVAATALAWVSVQSRRPVLLGACLVLIGAKPTDALPVLVVLLYAVRGWPARDWLRLLAPGALAVVFSFAASGLDWPLRWALFIRISPPLGYNVSLYKESATLLWPLLVAGGCALILAWVLRRQEPGGPTLGIALLLSLISAPYVVPYHFVAASPALAVVLDRNRRLGLALWLASIIAFIAWITRSAYWITGLYPVLLLASVLFVTKAGSSTPRVLTRRLFPR